MATPQSPEPSPLTAGELFAWLAIIVMTMLLFVSNLFEPAPTQPDLSQKSMEVTEAELVGKIAFVMRDYAQQAGIPSRDAAEMLDQLNSGSIESRLCHVLGVNEFENPDAGQSRLDEIDQLLSESDYEPNERQSRLLRIVADLIAAHAGDQAPAAVLSADDADYLRQQLGWFGALGLSSSETSSPERDAVTWEAWFGAGVLAAAAILALVLIFSGILGSVIFSVLLLTRRLTSQLPDQSGAGPIYTQTFAIWMALFFCMQFAVVFMAHFLGLDDTALVTMLPVMFFASLAALAWPRARGLSWSQIRQDIGWYLDQPCRDSLRGVAAYASGTPWMAGILWLTLVVAMMIGSAASDVHELAGGDRPSHPIVSYLSTGNWLVIVMIFVSTCIAAPIVEETMFRGVLYRSLRDRTSARGRWTSVALSAGLNSLIFAAIHPQGLVGIPVLMTLAIGFSLVRQWRGSLAAPILMHALNNFLVTSFAMLIMA